DEELTELNVNYYRKAISPTEGVLRMNRTTLQMIATRNIRPNDPITRIRKDPKLTIVPPPELFLQQARMSGVIISEQVKDLNYAGQEIKAPSVILAVIREKMDAYIDVTKNCISILWQFASHTQFNSVD
ncbi:MAG: hypothetical protein EZS28_021474, partial [Streblomastix strix]